ncbi:MAG: carbamoyltransferase HypF [Chitinophagaceae bacterium]
MIKISTFHIQVKGQVQGVGFRPFIFQLAEKYDLTGWVNNTSDGVHIEFNADEVVSKNFYDEIILNSPSLSHITSHEMEKTSWAEYDDFKIIESCKGNPVLLISPDFAMCENCRKEINDKTNRRYHYAFTTCTQCGPRYSIITQLPYDRENTAMKNFKMCNECNSEYNDAGNRRHFSQTNSCPNCPVIMKLFDSRQNIIEDDQVKIILKICDLWNNGKIVAIKGIGGYLLTCDATNEKVIAELRKRKHRPSKPFALMFRDLLSLEKEVYLNKAEIKELESVAAPIVLLKQKTGKQSSLALHQIAPRLSNIGVMLPYTPLYELLLQQFSKPIVATSGNVSNSSIVFENEVALNELNNIADYILVNNREIISAQDDSVIKYSFQHQQRIILRRARGFAPFYPGENIKLPQTIILALGALLKSSFSLLHRQNIHVSQYLGNTDNYDSQKNFEEILHHFLELFHAKPEVILVDKHHGYFTSQLGEQLAKKWDCQLIKVQHHEAHFASILGEYNLLLEAEPILGVVWDGTGLGNDEQIWGGEFFIYHEHTFSRIKHFDYFNFFLGDKMALEPRLSAFSLCHEIEEAASILQPKFTIIEWNNYQKLIAAYSLKTSSVGRLFDAVASLLGLIDKSTFEGEAAMLLEDEAHQYFKSELHIPNSWMENNSIEHHLSTQSLMKEIIIKIKDGENKPEIAAWFHVQLVLAVQRIASRHNCIKICFSGGVFQNGLLIDLLIKLLGVKHDLYFNKDLSPNDENISFGQLMWFTIKERHSLIK